MRHSNMGDSGDAGERSDEYEGWRQLRLCTLLCSANIKMTIID